MKARVSNRLARHFAATPLHLTGEQPMVSFTFDDIPDSAAGVGATLLDEFGARGTFYVAGGLVAQRDDYWLGADAGDILGLHAKGHEIACHTFSHRCTSELDAAEMAHEIELNRRYFGKLDPSIRLENFAYPYGVASITRKGQLANAFHSARGILPGINCGDIDLHFLHAMPLVDQHVDEDGLERAFDETVRNGGWLIFYGHDVSGDPSPYGCTPALLRHALEAAHRRRLPMVTVAEALRRAQAQVDSPRVMADSRPSS